MAQYIRSLLISHFPLSGVFALQSPTNSDESPLAKNHPQTLEDFLILKKKLSVNEFWIWIDGGLPLQIANIRHLAQILLSAHLKPPRDAFISEKWVSRFIQRHPELKSKYTRQYGYPRAKCEDPKLIKDWFNSVQDTTQRFGILEKDIYNMDETGFQIGMASTTSRIITLFCCRGAKHLKRL